MNCINESHPEYLSLLETTGLKKEILSAKISVWQVANEIGRFPSLEELTSKKVKLVDSPVKYQNNTNQSKEDYIASEKTIRDLAERIADRIGLKVRYESDRTKDYKGKLEGDTAVINLAYATLDTPVHEILGHPIIRSLKTSNTQLYQNLLKELETGKGEEVLDRVKRDYIDKPDPLSDLPSNTIPYTLEEQQEEAIVELLGLYTTGKIQETPENKGLIGFLKQLLKEMKAFMRDLIRQKEVEIDKLPDNMTLGDIADLLAYSNSKLILPGNEVVYTTPDNQQFKTYQEASNHISELVKSGENVDLNNIRINKFSNIPNEFETPGGIAFSKDGKYYLKELSPNFDEEGNFVNEDENIIEISKDRFINQYKDSTDYHFYDKNLDSFIEKNKEYEQSAEIIEEWKKVNDIKYDPEEVYSRGQGFYSIVGAYSDFDVELMFQNLLAHIEDNKKAGGKFAISALTKPVDKRLRHIEGTGGKIRFKIFPKSEDILWAAGTDVFSGSVWDASEKVNKDKKSELIGVSYSKYPQLQHIHEVEPNLANIIDRIHHAHNELGIELTGNNFRLEYDNDVPYSTKKLINNINNILDQKFGKLVEPKIYNSPVNPDLNKTKKYYLTTNDGSVVIAGPFVSSNEAENAPIIAEMGLAENDFLIDERIDVSGFVPINEVESNIIGDVAS
jgi:hypothetical protein